MIRAGGLRSQKPDGRRTPSDAGRRPARPGRPIIRAGGPHAQKPNGRVAYLEMRRAQDIPLYGLEACARRRVSLSAGNYVVIECNLKPKAANPLTHLIVASTSSQTQQTVVYQAVIEQRESDRFQSQDRWGLSESAPRPE